jgi:hypothetical protein
MSEEKKTDGNGLAVFGLSLYLIGSIILLISCIGLAVLALIVLL